MWLVDAVIDTILLTTTNLNASFEKRNQFFPWTGLLGLALNTENLTKKLFDYDAVIILDLKQPLLSADEFRNVASKLSLSDIVTLDHRGLDGPLAMNYKGLLSLAHYAYIQAWSVTLYNSGHSVRLISPQ